MKKVLLLILLSLSIVLGTGCVRPSDQTLSNADYGEYPNNYEEIVKTYIGSMLKDPYSAHITFDGPPSAKFMSRILQPTVYGFGGIVTVNAKNSFGAYTGAKRYAYIIHNGRVVVLEENFRTN